MAVSMIGPKFYAWSRCGKPLAFGKLYTYEARTNIPKPTYQSEDAIVENANPVILNGEGYANVYLAGSYKMVLKDDKDNEIWTSDPVSSPDNGSGLNYVVTAVYVGPSSYKVLGQHTSAMAVGSRVRLISLDDREVESTIIEVSYLNGFTNVTIQEPVVQTNVTTALSSNGVGAVVELTEKGNQILAGLTGNPKGNYSDFPAPILETLSDYVVYNGLTYKANTTTTLPYQVDSVATPDPADDLNLMLFGDINSITGDARYSAVFRHDLSRTAIENMQQGIIDGVTKVEHNVGNVYSVGAGLYEVVSSDTQLPLDGGLYAKPIGVIDAGAYYSENKITQTDTTLISLVSRVNRVKAVLIGDYTMLEDVFFDFSIDASNAKVTSDNTFIVGRVVNFVRAGIEVKTPTMVAITKFPLTETVGVRIQALQDSEVHVNSVSGGYTKGLQVYSYGAPVVFNTIYLKDLYDNFINMAIETAVYTPDPAYISYCNENLFIGGHLGMAPSAVSDSNRVQLYGNDRDRGINGNYWLKTSVELPTFGAGQPTDRFIRFVNGCSENFLIGVRPEGVGEFRFEGSSSNNNLSLGSQSSVFNVLVVETDSAADNYVERLGKNGCARSIVNPMVFTNSLNEDRTIMDFIAPLGAGGVHNRTGNETTYSTRHLYDGVSYKKTNDTTERVKISSRSKSGLDVSRGFGALSMVSNTFSCATNAVANGANFVFNPDSIAQDLKLSEAGVNIVSAEVVAYRESDGKFYTGRFLALVKYDSGVSADYSVISETLTQVSGNFDAVTFSLGSGVGKGSVISPRVAITDGNTASLKVEAMFTISSSNSISN